MSTESGNCKSNRESPFLVECKNKSPPIGCAGRGDLFYTVIGDHSMLPSLSASWILSGGKKKGAGVFVGKNRGVELYGREADADELSPYTGVENALDKDFSLNR